MAQDKELKSRMRELDDALAVAKARAKRVQSAVPYAGNIYDAVEDVIHACDELKRETRNA